MDRHAGDAGARLACDPIRQGVTSAGKNAGRHDKRPIVTSPCESCPIIRNLHFTAAEHWLLICGIDLTGRRPGWLSGKKAKRCAQLDYSFMAVLKFSRSLNCPKFTPARDR
jgi:hypothetical protein